MPSVLRVAFFLVLSGGLTNCASSESGGGAIDAPGSGGDGPGGGDGGGGIDAGFVAMCPAGQVATAVAPGGDLTCTTITAEAAATVAARCSMYAGWRDSCGACTDAPAKWSQIGPGSCAVGGGAGNACITATLDDPNTPVALATLDLDGNVNDDDKLYAGMHCIAAPRPPRPAPCAPGWAISSRNGSTWMCTPISEAVVAYVGQCTVHIGWRDSCDGCTTAPAKWGASGEVGCSNGAGGGNTCHTVMLGTESVKLFGLDLDGDVDGNDKLYLGLACPPGDATPITAAGACPDGTFVVGTNADGGLTCAAPSPAISAYMADRCSLFFGWHDSCGACTAPPTKWGMAGTASCANGAGADNTCAVTPLGASSVNLFGLSTDGDVNDDDTLYYGFRCKAP